VGAEVQVVAGQVAVVLVGAGEVGVHSAGWGPYVGGGAVYQSGLLELGERGVAVSGGAVLVDVQDVGAGGAGGDGQVPAGAAAEPAGDLHWVGGGVAEAVSCGGDLGAGLAGEHGPAGAGVGQGLAEHRGGHGAVRGRLMTGAG
jgi:hypothetical protein